MLRPGVLALRNAWVHDSAEMALAYIVFSMRAKRVDQAKRTP
jgi:hypothetical protein